MWVMSQKMDKLRRRRRGWQFGKIIFFEMNLIGGRYLTDSKTFELFVPGVGDIAIQTIYYSHEST